MDSFDVDQAKAELSLEELAARCNVELAPHGSPPNVRIDCPFNCPGDHVGKREISVNVGHRDKVFRCHSYRCQVRGNALLLMHGWLTGELPLGGKLKGDDFKRVKRALTGEPPPPDQSPQASDTPEADEQPSRNVPLAESENERSRDLLDIDEKFVVDAPAMNPKASAYVRQRPFLSPALMKAWRVGYLPRDGGGDKRGWSLRGHIIYPFLSEDNQLLGWVGRDPAYEEKLAEFERIPSEKRGERKPPAHHRFPKGFQRGLELFGQHRSRLQVHPEYREMIAKTGVLVVEGFNDVMALDAMEVPAVGICSNEMTEAQITKVARWARRLAKGKVSLMLDCDEAGEEGAKRALWQLAQHQLDVRLAWSQTMHDGKFAGRQPESLDSDEWQTVIRPSLER